MLKIDDFEYDDWINQWAGNWSFLSFSYWGDIYSGKPFTKHICRFIEHSVLIWRAGKSCCFWRTSEKEKIGVIINDLTQKEPDYLDLVCKEVKSKADRFLLIVDRYYGKDITFDEYMEFQNALLDYYPAHMQIKTGADYLDADIIEKYLPKIEEARVYVEPVFDQSEKFMANLAGIHSQKTGYDSKLILCTYREEFHRYLKDGIALPSKEVLENRYNAAGLLSYNGENLVLVGTQVDRIEKIINAVNNSTSEITGIKAYPGKASGIARLVSNPREAKVFNKGDVLVTGMTRPDYLSLMKKSSAFVTDSGGILCHAAIVARELKKPCVIGTKIATKVLKDGDLVEVDADKGIVRILEQK